MTKKCQKPKLCAQIKRRILRAARTSRYNARQLQNKFDATVPVRRVHQLLRNYAYLGYKRVKIAPSSTHMHHETRVHWRRHQLRTNPDVWHRTVFCKDKRFCLDGPDGAACYWANKLLSSRIFSRRKNRRSLIMVWSALD